MDKAKELSCIKFPECAKTCETITYLGAGECENVCPEKFNKEKEEEKK